MPVGGGGASEFKEGHRIVLADSGRSKRATPSPTRTTSSAVKIMGGRTHWVEFEAGISANADHFGECDGADP